MMLCYCELGNLGVVCYTAVDKLALNVGQHRGQPLYRGRLEPAGQPCVPAVSLTSSLISDRFWPPGTLILVVATVLLA